MRHLAYRLVALREQCNVQNAVLYVYLTYKDVDRLRNGSVHKLYCLEAYQISKVHARSHEIPNVGVQTTKTLKTIMLRRTPQMVKNTEIVVNRTSKIRQTALGKEESRRSSLNGTYLNVI